MEKKKHHVQFKKLISQNDDRFDIELPEDIANELNYHKGHKIEFIMDQVYLRPIYEDFLTLTKLGFKIGDLKSYENHSIQEDISIDITYLSNETIIAKKNYPSMTLDKAVKNVTQSMITDFKSNKIPPLLMDWNLVDYENTQNTFIGYNDDWKQQQRILKDVIEWNDYRLYNQGHDYNNEKINIPDSIAKTLTHFNGYPFPDMDNLSIRVRIWIYPYVQIEISNLQEFIELYHINVNDFDDYNLDLNTGILKGYVDKMRIIQSDVIIPTSLSNYKASTTFNIKYYGPLNKREIESVSLKMFDFENVMKLKDILKDALDHLSYKLNMNFKVNLSDKLEFSITRPMLNIGSTNIKNITLTLDDGLANLYGFANKKITNESIGQWKNKTNFDQVKKWHDKYLLVNTPIYVRLLNKFGYTHFEHSSNGFITTQIISCNNWQYLSTQSDNPTVDVESVRWNFKTLNFNLETFDFDNNWRRLRLPFNTILYGQLIFSIKEHSNLHMCH